MAVTRRIKCCYRWQSENRIDFFRVFVSFAEKNEEFEWCDVLSSGGAVFEEFGLVLSAAMTSQCIRSQSLALSSRCGRGCCRWFDCCCSSMLSSNNCHSHSGFSRMSRQKAWRTCQRPQGFDSCMHKTLARFRSQQDTAQDILYDIIYTS